MRLSLPARAGLLAAALLAGCAPMNTAADVPPLAGTAWELVALPGGDPAAGAAPTLRFDKDRASGSDGCNRFAAGYTAEGGTLAIAMATAVSTQMACPPAVMKQADAFMAALGAARSYRVDGGRLQLLGADGSLRATLAVQSQALAGTRWRATAVNNGKGAVASLVPGSTVTLAFGADGRASGTAGCNRYTAGYAQDGTQLRLQPPATTRMACADDSLMAQEQAFLQALQTVTAARVEGKRLELRTATGALAVSLQREGGD